MRSLIRNLPKYIKFRVSLAIRSLISDLKLFAYCAENECKISHISNLTGPLSCLKVGKGTVINSYANFRFKKGEITIGKGCLFGQNVTILANTYEIADGLPPSPERMYSKDVKIGDFVWIGANVVILPGITIGSNSIIGSSAVVTRDIPDNEIWGGVPAKKIK